MTNGQNRGILAAVVGGIFVVLAAVVAPSPSDPDKADKSETGSEIETPPREPVPPPVPEAPSVTVVKMDPPLVVSNQCGKPVRIWLYWSAADGVKAAPNDFPWEYTPGEKARPALDNKPIRPLGGKVYFRARAEGDLVWEGNFEVVVDGRRVSVVEAKTSYDNDGNLLITLSCDNTTTMADASNFEVK